jgi:hypothetical protein
MFFKAYLFLLRYDNIKPLILLATAKRYGVAGSIIEG